jgi:hypothetical protein
MRKLFLSLLLTVAALAIAIAPVAADVIGPTP